MATGRIADPGMACEVGVQPGVQEEEPMCIFEGGLVEDEEGELASRGSKPAAFIACNLVVRYQI